MYKVGLQINVVCNKYTYDNTILQYSYSYHIIWGTYGRLLNSLEYGHTFL